MTKPKAKKTKKADDTGTYDTLKVNPVEAEQSLKKPARQVELEQKLAQVINERDKAQAALEIIVRENAGELDEDIAMDFAGLGAELLPAVQSVRELRRRLKDVLAVMERGRFAQVTPAGPDQSLVRSMAAWIQHAVNTSEVDRIKAMELLSRVP